MRVRRPAAVVLLCLGLVPAGTVSAADRSASTLLVAFRDGVGKPRAERALTHLELVMAAWLPRAAVVRSPDPAVALAALRSDPAVAAAAIDGPVRVSSFPPSDPRFPEQWNLDQGSDADIDARRGWARVFGVGPAGHLRFPERPTGPAVGIIDTGVDPHHRDLEGTVAACGHARQGRVVRGGCLDDNGHGTHAAGILAARTDNHRGIAAVGPGLTVAVCKALGPSGSGAWSDVLACAAWLANLRVPAISMSFSGEHNAVAEEVFDTVWDGGRGPLLIAAAGNGGIHATAYPAGFAPVVSVAATNRSDRRWPFSNVNPDVEVAAPGQGILSTRLGGGYVKKSGTSVAVPHAAGIAGIVAMLRPGWTGRSLREVLRHSAEDLGQAGRDERFGWGRVNLARAVAAAGRAA
jgi:thermitase